MKTRIVIVAVLALASKLSISYTYADGKFRMSMQGRQGFSLLNLTETDGLREGVIDGTYAAMEQTADTFTIQMGQAVETMEVHMEDNHTIYAGFLHGKPAHMQSVPYKDGFYVYGDMDGLEFRVDVNQKKGTLYMYWPYDKDIEFIVDVAKNPATAGACKGTLFASGVGVHEELAKVFCQSEGSMADAFFTYPEDVIAWLVWPNVWPDENSDWPKH
jgi:hypothetical protein